MSAQRGMGARSQPRGSSHDRSEAPPKLLPKPLRAQSFHAGTESAIGGLSEFQPSDGGSAQHAPLSQRSESLDSRPSVPAKPLHLSQHHRQLQPSSSVSSSSASTLSAESSNSLSSPKPQISTRLTATQQSLLSSQHQSHSPRKLYPPNSLSISSTFSSPEISSPSPQLGPEILPKPWSMHSSTSSSAAQQSSPTSIPLKKPVPDFTHHNMNSPLSPRFTRISPVPSLDDYESSELTLEDEEETDPDAIQAHTLLYTHPFASQQQMNMPSSSSYATPRRSHANAPARIMRDARMGRVRRNWIQHFMGNFGAISRSSRVLLVLSCMVMVSEIIITTFVLLIAHSTGEVCDTSLDLYLIVYEVRVLLSLPLVVYQYLHPPLEEAYGHHRVGGASPSPTPVSSRPVIPSRPSLQSSAADSTTTITSQTSISGTQTNNSRDANNSNQPSSHRVYANPSSHHHRRSPRANFHVNKELSLLIDRLKTLLDIFSVIWFLAGNYWLLTSNGCYRTAPLVYYLSLAFLGMGYVVVSIPVFMCLGIVFCLPFVLVWTRVLRIGGANATANAGGGNQDGNTVGASRDGGDDADKAGNPLGLSDTVIRGIPVLTFRKKDGKQGMEKKRSSGYSDPQLLLAVPVVGGVAANGSIMGESGGIVVGGAGNVGSGNNLGGVESRRRGGGVTTSPQANVIVEVRDRISAAAISEKLGSRHELGEAIIGPRLPPRPRPSSIASSNLSNSSASVSIASKLFEQTNSISVYPPKPSPSSAKPPYNRPIPVPPPTTNASLSNQAESAHSSVPTARKSPHIPPRPKPPHQSPSPPRNLSKSSSPVPAPSPPPPVLRRPAPHTEVNALEGHDGRVDVALTEEDSVCVICLFGYEDGDRVRKLVCGHHFHVQCVDEWLRCNKTCPLCVQDVTADLIQQA
ncbi:hypothetical protein HDU77_007179 [Chytriomyces hyalinus]|nr:hypothetical protein HDU77_007179 [Chytriomyces hyalinus]